MLELGRVRPTPRPATSDLFCYHNWIGSQTSIATVSVILHLVRPVILHMAWHS